MTSINYSYQIFQKTILILTITGLSPFAISQTAIEWEENFRKALTSGDTSKIKSFYTGEFAYKEIMSWKYELKRGHLNFEKHDLLHLDSNVVLLHIPTNNKAYDGDNHDEYFDYIYRIYKYEKRNGTYFFTKRMMNEYLPDFKEYDLKIKTNIENKNFFFECDILVETKKPHLIIKLAKDFEIEDLRINNKKVNYKRMGYFIYCHAQTSANKRLSVRGKLKSPSTNNQFISMTDKAFFIRLGGFAAIPSPPPDNKGRKYFSEDSTQFNITYTYPREFTLLQYGNETENKVANNLIQLKSSISGTWMDEIAFYAQKDWNEKKIVLDNTQIGFYFKESDKKELNYIMAEVDTLVKWINKKFNNSGNFSINFVVLDNFVKGGLLNDGRSIVAQNAEIIGSDGSGYLHEICHSAPQPTVKGNYLWLKEGFTNFLSFEYLRSQKGERNIWEDSKRKYLHYFDLFEEPLINITSTTIPTYWSAYSKAPWLFRMIEAQIGEEKFSEALFTLGTMRNKELKNSRSYFEIYEQIADNKLETFEEQWLYRKKNPVLNVHGQLETGENKNLLKINVKQKEPHFDLPLEVEIRTPKNTFREIIWVKGKETNFEKAINTKEISIKYDPDSKLFALIKDQTKSFIEDYNFNIPTDTAVYFSEDNSREIQVWFTQSKDGIDLIKKENGKKSVLKLSDHLSPISYIADDKTIFSQDIKQKIIRFGTEQFDIAESIYPKEFVPFLFSLPDWRNTHHLSLLYLYPGRKRCQLIHCTLNSQTKESLELGLRTYLSDNEISLSISKGFPNSFKTEDGVFVKRKNR